MEAGCSVGSNLAILSKTAEQVVAFDSNMTALRLAYGYIQGEAIQVPRREEGRAFSLGDRLIQGLPLPNVSLVCGDALDPPLVAECADIVVAMNLLDSVASPLNLLGQMDAILKPGGLLVITSPFSWNDAITPPNEQLAGSLDPAFDGLTSDQALLHVLEGKSPYHPHLRYKMLTSTDVPWKLREHARCTVHYRVFACVLRKTA